MEHWMDSVGQWTWDSSG